MITDDETGAAWVLTEDQALELLAFLVTAARTQVDEAPEYGPMRLMTAAARLMDMVQRRVSEATREFLVDAGGSVPALATPMSDPDDYARRLDVLCAAVATHLEARFRGAPR
jgi:hypothetical protein